ncbi:unnamed protein product, partial [Owenia fusiformis]
TCEFTTWGEWSICSTNCGFGQKGRSRLALTPTQCNSSCRDQNLVEFDTCYSNSSLTNCQVGLWSEWSNCVNNCNGGIQTRLRNIIKQAKCGGSKENCSNTIETRVCPEQRVCEQICMIGECFCRDSFIKSDNGSCIPINCPYPPASICPPHLQDCSSASFNCPNKTVNGEYLLESRCEAFCDGDWLIQGHVTSITCTGYGDWTINDAYCIPKEKPPTKIEIYPKAVPENNPNRCPFLIKTENDNGPVHDHCFYEINGVAKLKMYTNTTNNEDWLCFTEKLNYESMAG